jgi:hypothetical protein
MSKTIEEIETEVLQLPEQDRGRLLKALFLSLEEADEGDVAGICAEEAKARALEIRCGDVEAIPSDEVFREARSRLK